MSDSPSSERWTICVSCGAVLMPNDEGACDCDVGAKGPKQLVEVVPESLLTQERQRVEELRRDRNEQRDLYHTYRELHYQLEKRAEAAEKRIEELEGALGEIANFQQDDWNPDEYELDHIRNLAHAALQPRSEGKG